MADLSLFRELVYAMPILMFVNSYVTIVYCESDESSSEESADIHLASGGLGTLKDCIWHNRRCDEMLRNCCKPDIESVRTKDDPVCGYMVSKFAHEYHMIFSNQCELISFRCSSWENCLLEEKPVSSCTGASTHPRVRIDCTPYQNTTPENEMTTSILTTTKRSTTPEPMIIRSILTTTERSTTHEPDITASILTTAEIPTTPKITTLTTTERSTTSVPTSNLSSTLATTPNLNISTDLSTTQNGLTSILIETSKLPTTSKTTLSQSSETGVSPTSKGDILTRTRPPLMISSSVDTTSESTLPPPPSPSFAQSSSPSPSPSPSQSSLSSRTTTTTALNFTRRSQAVNGTSPSPQFQTRTARVSTETTTQKSTQKSYQSTISSTSSPESVTVSSIHSSNTRMTPTWKEKLTTFLQSPTRNLPSCSTFSMNGNHLYSRIAQNIIISSNNCPHEYNRIQPAMEIRTINYQCRCEKTKPPPSFPKCVFPV